MAILSVLFLYTYALFVLVPYVGFRFNASTGEITDVYGPASTSSLQVGDHLVQVDQVTWADYLRDLHIQPFQRVKPGDVIDVRAMGVNGLKDIQWRAIGFTAQEFQARLFNTWPLSYVFWLAGTAVLLLVRPKNERRALLAAFYYVTAIWLIAGSVSGSRLFASPFLLRSAIWMSLPIYLHFHWVFPRRLKPVSSMVWVVFYIITALLALAQWVGWLPNSAYIFPFALAIVGSAALLVVRFAFRSTERREIGLLLLGVVFAFCPAAVIAFLSTRAEASTRLAGFLFSLLILPGIYFYVVYRRQLGGSELRANRLISLYLFIVLLMTIGFGALPLVSASLDTPEGRGTAILVTAAVASLVSIVGFSRFQFFVERKLLRAPAPPEHLLAGFAGKISTSLTQRNLVRVVQIEVLPSLLIRQSALISFQVGDGNKVEYLQGLQLGDIPSAAEQRQYAVPGSRERSDLGQTYEGGWLRLVLPIRTGKEIIGLWLLGRKDPDDYYSYGERKMLASLADQIGIALVNISQAEDLHALFQADIVRQESERLHLARELHDDILPRINDLAQGASKKAAPDKQDQAQQQLNERIRRFISGLRPAMLDYGLYHTFNGLVEDLTEAVGDEIRIRFDLPKNDARFESRIEENTFRIVQQACENAVKHGKPRSILLRGSLSPEQIDIEVKDDGKGFEAAKGTELPELLAARHFGLAGMSERAALIGARLEIASTPGQGTVVHLHWQPGQ